MTDFFQHIYTHRAEDYDRLVTPEDYQGNLLRALQGIRPLSGATVVEFGAGTGRLTRLLSPHVNRVLACDASNAMLRVAEARTREATYTNCAFALADNRQMPVAVGVADLAIEGWSFGHLAGWYPETWRDELDLTLSQVRHVLKPGGTAVIIETLGTGRETPQPPTDALAALYKYLEQRHGYSVTWIRTDYRFASLAEAEELSRFFFGDELAERVARGNLVVLPECTGVWWRTYL